MPSPSTTIDCTALCANALPAWESQLCSPEVNVAEIDLLLMTQLGNPIATDESIPTEWATRKALLDTDPKKIIEIPIVAEKAEPQATEVLIENDTLVTTAKTFTVTGESYQTSQANHEAYRKYNCKRKVLIWYRTASGLLYGGKSGIEASIIINEVISKSRKDLIHYKISLVWNSTTIENRCPSPF